MITVKLQISVTHHSDAPAVTGILMYTQNFWVLTHMPSTGNALSSTRTRKVMLTGLKGWYRQLSVIVRTLS